MWLFRLPSIVYFLLAPLGLALSVWLYIDDQHKEADKAAALASKPPEAVGVEHFDLKRDGGKAEEAVLIGQVDLDQAYELSKTKNGVERDHYVFAPLYAADAKAPDGPANGVIMQHGKLNDDQIRRMMIADGPFGPVLKIDGAVLSSSEVGSNADQFMEHVKVEPLAPFIDPFEEGRKQGLKASSDGFYAAIGLAVISLLVALYGLFIRGRERARREQEGSI